MTRDQVLRMAEKAGIMELTWWSNNGAFERFAALVAAAERKACAEVCEQLAERNAPDAHVAWVLGNKECVAAIRARGENK